ncbi:hypothetical protein OK016_07975 [Vibrio chagasii]|nr:hypothetical protein [Vibrio chagasii]
MRSDKIAGGCDCRYSSRHQRPSDCNTSLNDGGFPAAELHKEVKTGCVKEIGPITTPDVLHWTDSLCRKHVQVRSYVVSTVRSQRAILATLVILQR